MGWLVNATASARKPVVFAFAMLWLVTACACMICFAPVIDTYSPLSMIQLPVILRLVRDLDDGLRLLIGRRDDLRVGVEGPLRRDHVDQLRGQVDVGTLEGAGLDAAEARRGCRTLDDVARGEGLRPIGVAQLLQALRIGKVRHGQLPEFGGTA